VRFNEVGSIVPSVVQATPGVFHHFDLAKQLDKRGALVKIFSSFHWGRLQREGLKREKVATFPLIHPALMVIGRYRMPVSESVVRSLAAIDRELMDRWMLSRLPACDVFVGLSGLGTLTAREVQRRGGIYICDRGSSHILYQDKIMVEEYRRWGVSSCFLSNSRAIRKEIAQYEEADAITVPSDFALQSFVEMGVARSKLHKVSYGANLSTFYPEGEPDPDTFEVLFVGQVSYRKGIPYLLEAFRKFSHPRKKLRIIGTVFNEVKPLLAKYQGDDVEVLGSIPQVRLRRFMSTSHVMVLPSIEEGLALVQGQAMACRCPLISSTNTGGRDLFTHGVEGFEIPIRSVDAIVERLTQLADDPLLRNRMADAALQRVKSIGGWQQYGDEYFNLISDLHASKHR